MDTIDISEMELRMFVEDLMQLSQCTVCKETLKAPLVTCEQGHFSCSECQKEKCDVCSSDIVKDVQLSTVTKWLQHMPKECEFSNRGCRVIILPSSPHESYCPYSYTCKLCGAVGHITNHVETMHSVIPTVGNTYIAYWDVMGIEPQEKYILIKGSLFMVSVHLAKGYVTTKVWCLKNKRSDTDFIYTVEYRKGDLKYVHTGNVLDYKCMDKFDENDENFMNFPASKLPYLYEHLRLKYTIRITKFDQVAESLIL